MAKAIILAGLFTAFANYMNAEPPVTRGTVTPGTPVQVASL